jgi:soluble lytic murein transglycosylase
MKKKNLITLSLLPLGLLFQNFTMAAIGASTLPAVDQKARVSHAKELLGRAYLGSPVQRAEKIKDLHVAIYEDVRRNLPAKYKGQTLALADTIINVAQAHDLDPVFVMAVIKTESSFNPHAHGSHGEIGLMQLKPDTAKWIAEREGLRWHGPSTLESPIDNVKIGVAYMSLLRDQSEGYANKYLSAYNMGLAKVRRIYNRGSKPHEYSLRVMHNYKDLYTHMVSSRTTIVAGN